MDELDDKWYPIELIIYATEHFFFTLCIATRTIQLWYISKNLAFLVPYLLFLMVQVMDIQWN